MAFSTFPNNPFPPSTAQFEEGKNDAIQAEIDAIKDGTNIDSFGDVETALASKTNLSNIAPAFDATSGVYAVGDKVVYNGVLYEFSSAHSTAGEWDESEVQPVKVSELIDTLKSGLTNLVKTYTAEDVAFSANGNALTTLPIANKVLCALIDADVTSSIVATVYKAVGSDGYVYGLHAFRANTAEDIFSGTANVTVYYI